MHIGCWNVQGLTNKVHEIPSELVKYNMDIVVLAETNKRGKGEENMENYIHFWTGIDKGKIVMRATAGVSILIHKKYKKCITHWSFISERIIPMELKIFGRKICIIGIYSPTDSVKYKKNNISNCILLLY